MEVQTYQGRKNAALEIIVLKIRDRVAAKEFLTAQAAMEFGKFGEWKCDWANAIQDLDGEIGELWAELEKHL